MIHDKAAMNIPSYSNGPESAEGITARVFNPGRAKRRMRSCLMKLNKALAPVPERLESDLERRTITTNGKQTKPVLKELIICLSKYFLGGLQSYRTYLEVSSSYPC